MILPTARYLLATMCALTLGVVLAPQASADTGPLLMGLSVGGRRIVGSTDRAYSTTISPVDSTLKLDPLDRGAAVFSATAALFPFYKEDAPAGWGSWARFGSHWGVEIHADIARLSGDASFNQAIEGGLGFAFRVSKQAAVSLTWEKVKNRLPRDYVIDLENQQIHADGGVVTTLDISDERFFRDDYLDAVRISVMWFPNIP